MNKLLSILLFLFTGLFFIAQNSTIDSLKNVLNDLPESKERVEALFDLFTEYEYVDPDIAEQYINDAIILSEKIGDSTLIGLSYRKKGWLYEDISKPIQALKIQLKTLEIFENLKDQQNIANSYGNIGNIYDLIGDFEKALEYQHKSLSINEQILASTKDSIAIIKAKEGKSYAISNLGGIYKQVGNLDKSLDFQLQSLEMEKEANNIYGMAISYNSIGVIYKSKGELEKAKSYLYKSLDLSRESGPPLNIANCYLILSIIAEKEKQYNTTLIYLDSAKEIMKDQNDINTLCNLEYNRANTYFKMHDLKNAEKLALNAFELSKKAESITLTKVSSHLLSDIYIQKQNYKPALEYYKESIKYRDSLYSLKNEEAFTKKDLEFEFANERFKDSIENAELQNIKDLQIKQKEAVIAKEKTFKTALIIGLSLLVLIAFVLYRGMQRKKKDHQIISEQKIEVEKQRDFANQQKQIAEDQANLLEEKNKEITDSITYAKRIQSAILPPQKLFKQNLNNSFILYKPKDIVAGDFYWMEQVEKTILFAAADCTGHGVPGAMVSVVCNNGLNRSVREYELTKPARILDKTREIVLKEFEKSEEDVKDGMDIAIVSIEENETTGNYSLQYAGAHNPLWIIRKRAEEVEEIKADKQPVGKYAEEKPFTNHEISLQSGDTIYVFSDGYADQFGGERGKKFKTANFKKLLLSIQEENMERQQILLDEAFEEWRGKIEQIDDVCVIGVRI